MEIDLFFRKFNSTQAETESPAWNFFDSFLLNLAGIFVIILAFAEESPTRECPPSLIDADPLAVEWLHELPEDLDVAIAQRDFEGAVDLVDKGM